MSISSYRQNVKLGVTGVNFETCFPAAFEKISPDNSFKPNIYRAYPKFVKRYNKLDIVGRYFMSDEYESLLNKMAEQLGGFTCEQAIFFRPSSRKGFVKRVAELVKDDYRVVLDVEVPEIPGDAFSHSVGIASMDRDQFIKLRSNWVPKIFKGWVQLGDIYEFLAPQDDEELPPEVVTKEYPFNDANVTALPPAA